MSDVEWSDVECRLRALLSEVYLPEGVDIWMTSRNRNLGGRTAQELLDSGDHEQVLEEVKRLVGGAW